MNFAPFSRAVRFTFVERATEATQTIRGRLWIGSLVVVALLVIAGTVAWRTLNAMSHEIAASLRDVQTDSRLASQMSSDAAKTLEAGMRYLDTRDPDAETAFRQHGWNAHDIQRAINGRPDRTADEVATVALIDSKLSAMEVGYARAHRLVDIGRVDEARRVANSAQRDVDDLLGNIDKLGLVKAQRVTNASVRLTDETRQRAAMLLGLIVGAVIIALGVVIVTVSSIGKPLTMLVHQAQRLSEGDLTVRSSGEMPGEFEILAHAMNETGDSLARIVTIAAKTAENVATSAHDLASVSEQISLSAGQMASAMTDVSHGAETQVRQLRAIDETLSAIRESADGVRFRSSEVNDLAREIESSAAEKRQEVQKSVGMLRDVKAGVERAAAEVIALNSTTAEIHRFVSMVAKIADQTNLLALNAAIEAARAGTHGRGFAVVADEVRKLASQAQRAADDILQVTEVVTDRVSAGARAMEVGAARVVEIEHLSATLEAALHSITTAAERTRVAAEGVAAAAETNLRAVHGAASSIESIARTAESHATAAEQVNASTEEQSAACEQMSSASSVLLEGSTQLKKVVGVLRVA
ncbi:MAG TPA: methyl-accepting chemotaxis protein [Gemmatimonadaceae bacterium]|nr:methyl-accepting chemotaxis protein [Gemmatimonadaceae bacterium]